MSRQADVLARLADAIERQNALTAEHLRELRAQRQSSPEIEAIIVAHRKPLRPFSAGALLRAAPFAYAEAFQTVVPLEFLTMHPDQAIVRCPCGDEHSVNVRGYPYKAECGRYFLWDGRDVLVSPIGRSES